MVQLLPQASNQRYPKLNEAGKLLARKPRYARLIARLPIERVGELSTKASTYWEIYSYVAEDRRAESGMIDEGLRTKLARKFGWHGKVSFDPTDRDVRRWQVELAMMFLGAIAFEMMWPSETESIESNSDQYDSKNESIPRPHVDAVHKREYLDFTYDRIENSNSYVDFRRKPINTLAIHKDWGRLKKMDSHGLKSILFRDSGITRIEFTDITLRDFFAAYWACNYADVETDFDRLWQCVPDPLFERNMAYQEFWNFVAEMPDAALLNGKERWENLMAPIFAPSKSRHLRDEKDRPIRSTELIYRAWDRMAGTDAMNEYCSEFDSIHDAKKDSASRRIARNLLKGFSSLCEGEHGPNDNGVFTMGAPSDECPEWDSRGGFQDNPEHPVVLTPFCLHRFCVTNREFELFDSRHSENRVFTEIVASVDDHPVVNVSWYDAICYASWVGVVRKLPNGKLYRIELPTEARWEYACRAGNEKQTPFSWTDGLDSSRIESGYCNFDGNYPWPNEGEESSAKPIYLRRTIPVSGQLEDGTTIGVNKWKFSQMHGNVWEWCWDWYDSKYYGVSPKKDPLGPERATRRVLRGCSWIYSGEFCRSAYRSRDMPSDRNRSGGFRLAAVPIEPGQ